LQICVVLFFFWHTHTRVKHDLEKNSTEIQRKNRTAANGNRVVEYFIEHRVDSR
jgi:hypothetical protein